jgi:hypothetical protein
MSAFEPPNPEMVSGYFSPITPPTPVFICFEKMLKAQERCVHFALHLQIHLVSQLSCEEEILPLNNMSPHPEEKNDNAMRETSAKKDSNGAKRMESNINDLLLWENVAGGRGAYTTVSVLEPMMRIERTNKEGYHNKEHHQEEFREEEYRIVVNFNLQVKIHAFEKGFVTLYDDIRTALS